MKFNSSLSTLGVCSWCVQWVSLPCAPGLFHLSKNFSHGLGLELLKAWVVVCCSWAILIPPGFIFPLAQCPGCLCLLWVLVTCTAEHWGVQKWAWKKTLLAPLTEISPCFLCCSPSTPVTDSRSPPTNLFIDSETPSSLQVHWTPPDGRVQHYKITFSPVSDAAAQQTVSVQLLCRAQTLGQGLLGTMWPEELCPLQSGLPLAHQDSKQNLFLLMCCFVNRTPRLFCN